MFGTASYEQVSDDEGRTSSFAKRVTAGFGVVMGVAAVLVIAGRGGHSIGNARPVDLYALQSGVSSADESSDYITAKITVADWLDVSEVCAWLELVESVDDCNDLSEAVLLKYIPKMIKTRLRASLVHGSIGAQAQHGYATFNLVLDKDDVFKASWLVVVDYAGALKSAVPLYKDDHIWRACGLKLWDDAQVVFAAGHQADLTGYVFKWDWDGGGYSVVENTTNINIHDVQRAYKGDAVWSGLPHEKFGETSVMSGESISSHSVRGASMSDMNHIQPIEEDDYAIISSRLTNAIVKVHPSSGKVIWQLGGDAGDFGIISPSGEHYPAGHSYWRGQHNAQYGGDGEYYMFDNNYEHETAGSRLLIVSPDLETMNATVNWEYSTGAYTSIFGDNDRLPTGNVLACWWQSTYKTRDNDYDARVVELVRDTQETAFELSVYGRDSCDEARCDVSESWMMYSVERFYTAPIVYNVTCGSDSLSFTAFDTFRRSSAYAGGYSIYNEKGTRLAHGGFDFEAYWLATDVTVSLDSLPKEGTVKVQNEFGSYHEESFSC